MIRTLLLLISVALLVGCVSSPQQRPAAFVQGERLLELGVQAYSADDYVTAASHFTQALRHFQGLDDQAGILNSRLNLAETALAVGNVDACEHHLREAEPLANGAQAMRIFLLRSSVALHRKDYDTAEALLAALLQPPHTERALYRSALANRVDIAMARDDGDAAEWVDRYAAALEGAKEGAFVARLARFRAVVAYRSGDHTATDTLMQQALDLYKAIPARPGTAATLEAWGELLLAQQRWDEAEDRLQRAVHIRIWLLARDATAADLRNLAVISEAKGDQRRATAQRRWATIAGGSGPVDWMALKREVLP